MTRSAALLARLSQPVRATARPLICLALMALTATACKEGSMNNSNSGGGIDEVRAHRRAAIDDFARLWPAMSTKATGGVTAWGQYNQCDDYGKTFGYVINGIVVSTDVTKPAERRAATLAALSANGWTDQKALDSQEMARAGKDDMLLVFSTSGDRFLVSMQSRCARVTNAESDTLLKERISKADALDIPGIPDVVLPE